MQLLYQNALAEFGFAVTLAGTLREARAKCHCRRPDIVILDEALPDGTGKDLLEEFQNQWACIPIVTVSAYEGTPYAAPLSHLIAARFTKPFDLKDFGQTLSALASQSGDRG